MAVAGVQGNMAAQSRIMGHDAVAITASATKIPGTDTRGVALYVGSGPQDVTVTMESGTSTVFKGVAAGTFMPILVTHVTVGVDVIAIY